MSWTTFFEYDPRPVIQMLDAVEGEMKRWPHDDLSELAALAQARIDMRTAKGLDMYYNDFTRYSEAYLEWKRAHKELDEGDTMTVDLSLYGHMIAAMTPQTRDGQAVVGFTSRHEAMKADAHHEGRGHLPERQWMGVAEGTKDWDRLQSKALLLMSRRIENLGRFS